MSDTNLTGIWQGLYSYPAFSAHVSFTATLFDLGGALQGTTHEVDAVLTGSQLDASVSGRRDGRSIGFTKVYAVSDERFEPIAYRGALNADATEIEGSWTIPGRHSGTFLMIRPEREPVEASVRRTERV